ncbi:hypothetical protein [Coralliovum pocilloporae]|uniref:hypothetical protein n=1 Tax=Coralliovum pocilloporae TaxID=3066369 RepID=UPI003307B31D
MNTLIYIGVVIFGGLTLLIEAYRNYNSSLATIPFREHAILQDVEVAKLCTPREKNIGFFFYSLIYLLTYIIILSSSTVYDLVQQASDLNTMVGPTGSPFLKEDTPFGLTGTQYGKPIFISAAIIAVFSVGALRPLENTMRSLAHRIAGVPRGVYQVIEHLNDINYKTDLDPDHPLPLTRLFEKNAKATFVGSHDEEYLASIETSLRTIDYLSPIITERSRTQHFPLTQISSMKSLSEKLEKQIRSIKDTLKSPLADSETERQKLYATTNATANDTIALFSVHFLRNNKSIKNSNKNKTINHVHKKIKKNYQIEMNSFAMAILCASIISLTLCFNTYQKWVYSDENNIKLMVEREINAIKTNCPAENKEKKKKCEEKTNEISTNNVENKIRKVTINRSLWRSFVAIIPVIFVAIATIFGRDARLDDNSWPEWKLRRIPFLRLFFMALVPSILCVIGITSGEFIKIWADANFQLTESQIIFFFNSQISYILMHLGLGFILSIAMLVLMDQHEKLHNEITVLISIVFSALIFGWFYIIVLVGYPAEFILPEPEGSWLSFELREMITTGSLSSLFIIFFAIFLEVTEADEKDKGWWFVSSQKEQK